MVAKNTYSEEEIRERLKKDLPKWRFEEGLIRRKYETQNWKGTLMVINTVGHLAEAAWHHPDIKASFDWVEVAFMSHDVDGITDRDFELAKKVEETVLWRPGKEGNTFEGTPSDAKFAYVKYD